MTSPQKGTFVFLYLIVWGGNSGFSQIDWPNPAITRFFSTPRSYPAEFIFTESAQFVNPLP
jgi:hypothetical protein